MTATATIERAGNPPARANGYVNIGGRMAVRASTSREERRLARDLRGRDPEALRRLYERFGRVSFGFLLKALGDRGAAEEVQQQVYLEVWRRAESYDPRRGTLLTWVMTIARSRAIDERRRRTPEPIDPEVAATALDVAATGGDAEIEALAEQWRVRALLDRLPENEAQLLRLRFYEGLSQAQIAARDGIPLGTVKTRMFSGLRRLREMIEAENGA